MVAKLKKGIYEHDLKTKNMCTILTDPSVCTLLVFGQHVAHQLAHPVQVLFK